MMNFKMKVQYDGTKYNGWQKQGTTSNTIQEKMENAVKAATGEECEVFGSGRTDAGVHALGQVANFKCVGEFSAEDLRNGINEWLPRDIAVVEIEEAQPRFHSRLSAVSKTYKYVIHNSKIPNVFERKYSWMIKEYLDIENMKAAAEFFVGTHDFKGFCSNKRMKKSTVRNIYSIEIICNGEDIEIIYKGDGFLYNMIRIITGTLLEVGEGKRKAEDMKSLIDGMDREAAGCTAPPHGLTLVEVLY